MRGKFSLPPIEACEILGIETKPCEGATRFGDLCRENILILFQVSRSWVSQAICKAATCYTPCLLLAVYTYLLYNVLLLHASCVIL